jgi:hypothetical protein
LIAVDGLTQILLTGCIEGLHLNQFAAAWDILLVTRSVVVYLCTEKFALDLELICSFSSSFSSAADDLMKNRQLSPTWVTTTPFPPPNEVYCSFLAASGWTNVYVCLDRNDPTEYYGYASGRVASQLTSCGVNFIQNNFSSSDYSSSLPSILREFNSKSRSKNWVGIKSALLVDKYKHVRQTDAEHLTKTCFSFFILWTTAWTEINFGAYIIKIGYSFNFQCRQIMI